MTEVFEHNEGDHEDPLPGPTWLIGLLGTVLMVVIGLGLTALYYSAKAQVQDVQIVQRDPDELKNLKAEQEARLAGAPRRVEERVEVAGAQQVVPAIVIPIEQAMDIVVKEGIR